MMIAFIQRSAVLLLAFAFLFPAFGWGQVPDVGPGRCYANCDLPSYPSGGGGGGHYGGGGEWVLPNFKGVAKDQMEHSLPPVLIVWATNLGLTHTLFLLKTGFSVYNWGQIVKMSGG